MNLRITKALFLLIFVATAEINFSYAQIVSYTTATSGALNTINANVTATPLTRVNGAGASGSPCGTGFSSSGFTSTGTYSTSLAAIEVSVTPNPGTTINVTGFSADLRRSSTGPAAIRFAYSITGGSTWISQTTNQNNPNVACGAGSTLTWATTTSVSSPATLKFRIYGFKASGTSGNEQILNLKINGTVIAGCTPPTLATAVTNVKCNGGNTGAISLTVTGGSSPFTYHWSNGAAIQNIGNLSAGIYTLTVAATGGCSTTASAIISQPSILSAAIGSQTNTTCSGSTGGASVTASGGTTPYTYLWNSNPAQNASSAASLPIGNYSVTITDAQVCTATASAAIGVLSPSVLGANNITSSSATLTWSAISGANIYNIQYKITGASTWTTVTSDINTLSLPGLNSATSYQWQVQAVCSGGSSSFSAFSTFTTTAANAPAAGHIKVYFTRPVDTILATNQQAIFANQALDDTLIAYINRAKYTIDVAQYNYIQTSKFSTIATAVNNAYARGVKIRWIYNGGGSNSGLSLFNAAIPTVASPTTSAYGLMHNKFMVIDDHSTNSNDPIVWTGSLVWEQQQIDSDYNNVIIIQDKNLAGAYTAEFNQMWGDTGMVFKAATSKFGPYKSDITQHTFTIDSSLVECYFSPSDATNSHIINAINSANSQLFFGVYTFTDVPDADSIISRKNAGVYTAGIIDQYSNSYAAYPLLAGALGTMLEDYKRGTSIYHNKYMIVDPCNLSSDPLVETGSHNWTVSADTKNDENTLIIHNATIANIYYQSFAQDFAGLGGTLNACVINHGIRSETIPIQESSSNTISFNVFPNPSSNQISLQLDNVDNETTLRLINAIGQNALVQNISSIYTQINVSHLPSGIYFIELNQAGETAIKKILITR